MTDYRTELLALADAFVAATGRSEKTIANYAGLDGRMFTRLRDGARCWPETRDRLFQWFSDYWPEDLVWPADIARPAPRTDVGPAKRPTKRERPARTERAA